MVQFPSKRLGVQTRTERKRFLQRVKDKRAKVHGSHIASQQLHAMIRKHKPAFQAASSSSGVSARSVLQELQALKKWMRHQLAS